MRLSIFLVSLIGLLLAGKWSQAGPREKPAEPEFRLGFIKTLFQDMPETQMKTLFAPFGLLVEFQTKHKCQLIVARDPCQLSQWLDNGELEVGVYQGIEYAWICKDYPNLRPLVLALNQVPQLQSLLVVRSDSPVKGFQDLKGKSLAIPQYSREHCRLFLQGHCRENERQEVREYFSRVTAPTTAEDALDDVVDGLVQGAVIDRVGLEGYRRRKPARFAQIQTVVESPLFPPTMVVYRTGRIDETDVKVFRANLLKAKDNPLTRTFLNLGKLTGFEPIPEDYSVTLANIAKIYPRPKILASK